MTDYLRLAQQNVLPQQDDTEDNPYLPIAREQQALQQQRARTIIETALKDDPELAAERQRLAQTSGLPPHVIARNLEEVRIKERAKAIDLVRMANESPVLYRQLTDPTFTTVAIDDLDTLKKIERAVGAAKTYVMGEDGRGGLPEDLRGAAMSVGLGATVGVGKMIYDMAAVVNDLIGWESGAAGARNQAKRLQEIMDEYGLEGGTPTRDAIRSGLQSAGTNLALLPVGLARRLWATANQAASAVAGMIAAGVGAEAYNRARELGKSQVQSLGYAIPEAAFEFVFERIPASKLFGDIAVDETLLRMLGKQMFTESWTEQVTTLAQDFNEWMNLNPDKTLAEFINERPDAAYQTFVATLVGVGVQTSTIKAIDKIIEKASQQKLEFELDRFNEQLALASQSMLRQRSPEQFRALVQRIVDENTDAKKEIYVDGQVLNQLPPDVLAQLPEAVREQIPEAAASNSVVAIPMADVLTIAPGSPLEQVLNDNARMTPDSLSRIEVQQASEQAQEFLKQEAERVLAQAADQAAWQQSVNTVKQTILEQLNQAGRFTPDVNEAYAILQANFFSSMAARLGITPTELYQRYALKVAAQSPGGQVLDASIAIYDQGEVTVTDRVDEVTGLPLNSDGTVTLYHHTSAANAEAIKKSGMLKSAGEPDVYLTTREIPDTGYGDTVVRVRIDPRKLQLDDEFPDGRRDFRVHVGRPGGALRDAQFDQPATGLPDTIEVDGVQRPTTNSNGQPIAATEEGIRNFWRWFGDSKVVDEQGRPLVVYHGTKHDFAEFQLGRADRRDGGWFGDGFYLTASQDLASSYAMRERDYSLTDRPANVMPVYVRMSNPYRINLGELSYNEGSNFTKKYGGNEGFRKWLADNGYDGVIGYRDPEIAGQGAEFWEVVVFDSTQIKSAIGNRGAFNPASPNILEQSPISSMPDTIEVDGVQRPTRNSKGRLIHPTEEGIRNFWRWFEGSRIVDEQGRPLVMYHGTPEAAPTVPERWEWAERRILELAQKEEADVWSPVFARINEKLRSIGEDAQVSTPLDVQRVIVTKGKDFLGPDVVEMLNNIFNTDITSRDWVFNPVRYLEGRREKLTEDEIRILERAPFVIFDPKKTGSSTGARDAKVGFFFTPDEDFAQRFLARRERDSLTGRVRVWQGDRPMMYEVYLNIKNPIDLTRPTKKNAEALFKSGLLQGYDNAEDLRRDMASAEGSKFLQEILAEKGKDALMAAGFDGIINKVKPSDDRKVRIETIAFLPEQIKSATDNRGTFNPADPSILRQDPISIPDTIEVDGVQRPTRNSKGRLIHPTEEGIRNFWRWFGSSDAVDEQGRPLVVYHGTNQSFDSFSRKRLGRNTSAASSIAFFFTEDAREANEYAELAGRTQVADAVNVEKRSKELQREIARAERRGDWGTAERLYLELEELELGAINAEPSGQNIMPVYLSLQNPMVLDMRDGFNGYRVRDAIIEAKAAGHDGLKLLNVYDPVGTEGREFSTTQYVVFRPEQIKSATGNRGSFDANKSSILRQDPRGTFNVEQLLITLNENADLSTFLHESGHFFLEVMADLASQPNAPQQIVDDMAMILKWFGVPDLATWNSYTLDQKRSYHERWAESFEQYLFEGKAPSQELQPLFRRFRSWLINVYKSLTEFLRGRNLQLSDDIRKVFDRMIATDEEIAQAEEAAGMLPDFDATNEAIEKLQARSLRDLKWTINARNKTIKALQKQAAKLRKEIETEVRAEVEQWPVYRAIRWLKKGENGHRLSTSALAEMYPETMPDRPDITRLRGMTAKDGVHPDVVADMFGFESGDALVRAIVDAAPINEVVEGLTDRRMLERHGDLVDQRAIEEAANEAVHNEARARALATELKAQAEMLNPRQATGRTASNGRPITVNALTEAAKQFAQNLAARRRVKDLKNAAWQHRAAEARAAKRWQQATAKGDTQAAVQAKRDQLLNNYAAKALYDAQAEVKKIQEFFRRVTKGNNEKLVERGRDPDVVNAMRAILAAYGVAPHLGKSALEYMEVVARNDPDMYAALKPSVDAALVNAKPLGELTVEELRGLYDELRAMWVLAKRSRQMEVDGRLVDIEAAADELVKRMDEIGIPATVPGERGAITDREESGIKLQYVKAFLSRVEQWAERMDGKFGGPFLRLVFRPIKEAADRYRTARIEYRKRFTALVENIAPILRPGPIHAPELNYTFGNARDSGQAELLHAILHTGNESNKRKLLLGRGWATELPDGTLDTSRWDAFIARMINEGKITKAHYDFAQGVWDLLEEMKPLAQETHRKVFGRYFDEVTATPFSTPFGTYRGGYVPAQVDTRLVMDAKLRELAEAENESMAYAFPSSPRGFTKKRVEYNKPLLLDLRALAQHMDKVLLFSYMQGPVTDVRRLLTNKRVSYALGRIDPGAYEGMLIPWLNRAAKQIVETPVAGDRKLSRFLSAMRNRAGMALMFANLSNAVQQITGFSLAAVKVKPSLIMKATASFIANPKAMKEQVATVSEFMRNRMLNEVAAMNDAVEQILINAPKLEKAQDWAQRHAYFLQTAVDNTISPIIWTAAYNQAIEQKMSHKDAVRFADGVIRQTQGTSLPEDISRFESGSPFWRLFTQFMGYFNMMANTNATAMKQIADEMGLRKGAGKLLYVALMGLLAPIWVAEAIAIAFRGGPEDEDDDGYLDDWLIAVFGTGTLRGMVAMVPVVGQLAQFAVNRFNDDPADDKFSLSPAVSLLESAVSSPASVYKAIIDEGNAQKAVRDVAAAATLITGLPIYAAARPIGYLAGMADGRIEPTGPVDLARGLVTGTASPESKVP